MFLIIDDLSLRLFVLELSTWSQTLEISLVQIKHFTASQKLFNIFIKMCKMAVVGQNTQRQSKPILVVISIKPFTCQTELQTK